VIGATVSEIGTQSEIEAHVHPRLEPTASETGAPCTRDWSQCSVPETYPRLGPNVSEIEADLIRDYRSGMFMFDVSKAVRTTAQQKNIETIRQKMKYPVAFGG
jgi:hypothetical protein